VALRDENPGKPSAELLRRALAPAETAAEPCPDPEILAAYSERALDGDETAHYELHFARCARCREQLAAMVRAATPLPKAPRLGWIWNWGWIALAPVTAVLLVAAILIARHPASNLSAVNQQPPLVAMQPINPPPPQAALPQATPALAQPVPSPKLMLEQSRPQLDSSEEKVQRVTPPDQTVAVGGAIEQPAPSNTPVDRVLQRRDMESLPTNGRNYIQLQQPSASATPAPQPPAPQTSAAGRIGAVNRTVTVESSAETVTTASPVAKERASGGAAGVSPSGSANGAVLPQSAQIEIQNSLPEADKKLHPMQIATMPAGSCFIPLDGTAAPEAWASCQPTKLAKAGATIIASPDPQILWRIDADHFIDISVDHGANWRTQWTSPNPWTSAYPQLLAGSAPSVRTCWIVGRYGIVVLTDDGKTWHEVTAPADIDLVNVAAVDASTATVTAADGRKFVTHDGGRHWLATP
jgi:hypothetical protein